MIPLSLIESTTQGLHPTSFITNWSEGCAQIKATKGAKVGVLGQMERIPSNRGILGEWVGHGTCPKSHKKIPQ